MWKAARHLHIHTYILIVLTLLSFHMKAQELTPQPTEPPTKFVKINVQGTYFPFRQLGLDPDAQPATRFNLSELTPAVQAGTILGISRVGGFSDGAFNDDSRRSGMAVFINASGNPIAPGPETNTYPIALFPFCNPPPHDLPWVDYPHDFTLASHPALNDVGSEYEVQVPEGAVALLLAPADCAVSDNFDQNGDYGANIRVKLLKRDFYLGELTLPNANISEVDNLPTVQVDTLTEVKVPVFVSGLFAAENLNKQVSVTVSFGSQSQTQQIYLNELVANNNFINISVNIKFKPEDVGIRTIFATINSDKSIEEIDYTNNQVSQSIRVTTKYKILKTILYDDVVVDKYNQVKNPHFFEMRPTFDVRNATHCKPEKKFIPSVARIKLECIKDDGSFERVNDCQVQLKKTLGNFWGGHSDQVAAGDKYNRSHNNESRPLGYFATINQQLFNIDKEYKTIPKEGLTFGYVAPDPSGEVVLSFDAKSPEGVQFLVPRSTVQVKIGGLVRIDDLLNLEMIETGHFGLSDTNRKTEEGVYVTPRFKQQMRSAIAEYYTQSIKAGIPENQIIPLRSEAASLVWGGLYDIKHNWRPSHCGHRIGNAIDIGMAEFRNSKSQYATVMLEILKEALIAKEMWFPVKKESPEGVKHWHTELK